MQRNLKKKKYVSACYIYEFAEYFYSELLSSVFYNVDIYLVIIFLYLYRTV